MHIYCVRWEYKGYAGLFVFSLGAVVAILQTGKVISEENKK